MTQAFFNGLSGLFSFSKGLKTVSANVANMNTPGFRGTDNFFRNVGGNNGEGLGVEVSSTSLRTTQGELRQSGNATDMAINGRGFFILQDDNGNAHYTRAGQFRLNDQFQMTDFSSGQHLMALDAANALQVLDISALRMQPPTPTTRVDFSGNLVSGSSTFSINDMPVFDSSGAQISIDLTFTSLAPAQAHAWRVDANSEVLGNIGSGTIEFGLDGTPAAGHNTLEITLTSNGSSQVIALNFGTPGSMSGTTHFSGASSTVTAAVTDGSALTGLNSINVDERGRLQLTYANGKKQEGPQVALAWFADESALTLHGKALFSAAATTPETGAAGSGHFGKIQGGFLELSNVDLAQEFGDLIIIQRGYQASSRVMTVASEMIEQLYNK